ncbi:MAG: serine/threonine protein kinase [bacterium]|jgi:serine/threonine protein kinase
MHTLVSSNLHSQLHSLCRTGGVTVYTSMQFTRSMQGRIHDVYRVQTEDAQFIIQCLNPRVIKNSSALENLINNVLAPASISPKLLSWPATGGCVLHTETGDWIRRPYILGEDMTAQLSLLSFEVMASALSHFHQSISVADFEQTNFTGVNPWSGEATVSVENLLNQSTRMTFEERGIVDDWAKYKKIYIDISNELHTVHVVVHRDAKPSNFIRKPDGSLTLIDFDTIGIGDSALDLGELLRAWLSSDEVANEIDSECSYLTKNSCSFNEDIQCLAVTSSNCAQAILAMQSGYNDTTMTSSRIRRAAVRCCLWQCERFLEDHFAGDSYYSVQIHGENLIRAKQQLNALKLLDPLSTV